MRGVCVCFCRRSLCVWSRAAESWWFCLRPGSRSSTTRCWSTTCWARRGTGARLKTTHCRSSPCWQVQTAAMGHILRNRLQLATPQMTKINLQPDHLFLSSSPLSDIDGLGSSAIGGQLIRRASSRSPLSCDKAGSDIVMAGQSLVGIKLLQNLRKCPHWIKCGIGASIFTMNYSLVPHHHNRYFNNNSGVLFRGGSFHLHLPRYDTAGFSHPESAAVLIVWKRSTCCGLSGAERCPERCCMQSSTLNISRHRWAVRDESMNIGADAAGL